MSTPVRQKIGRYLSSAEHKVYSALPSKTLCGPKGGNSTEGLVRRVPEVVPGFPDRILPVDPEAAAILKTRTLTNLYNQRPAWLADAHRDLDAAVAAAYGWPADLSEEEALARLLALNLERSGSAAG